MFPRNPHPNSQGAALEAQLLTSTHLYTFQGRFWARDTRDTPQGAAGPLPGSSGRNVLTH